MRNLHVKIVSGVLGRLCDTSVLLKQFIDQGHQVVAMTLNLGESDMVAGDGSQDALEAVRQKALKLGARRRGADRRARALHRAVRAQSARGERAVPRRLSAQRGALAPADRRPARRDGGAVRRRRRRARLHRQGQRSGSHRGRRAREGAAPEDARAAARQAALAARRDRVRASARRADRAHGGEAVLGRREPVGPLDRSRRAREPVERAARGRLRVVGRAGAGARERRRGRDRVPPRHPDDRQANPARRWCSS